MEMNGRDVGSLGRTDVAIKRDAEKSEFAGSVWIFLTGHPAGFTLVPRPVAGPHQPSVVYFPDTRRLFLFFSTWGQIPQVRWNVVPTHRLGGELGLLAAFPRAAVHCTAAFLFKCDATHPHVGASVLLAGHE
jgi:hypothetical protein